MIETRQEGVAGGQDFTSGHVGLCDCFLDLFSSGHNVFPMKTCVGPQ